MRALGLLLVVAALLGGLYYAHIKQMPTTDAGTTPTQAISLTGVRGDLMQIAQAERAYVALNTKCASLEELVSSGDLKLPITQRDGYSYVIDCTASGFEVSAHHAPAPAGSTIRFPNLAIDQNMAVREVN